jgi:chromosome partitioning protein
MRVLALASQKGGSGKTTLTRHLAAQAERAGHGPVVLIDIDPQGSLSDWWNERTAEEPAFAQTTVARLAADLEILRQQARRLPPIPAGGGCARRATAAVTAQWLEQGSSR